VRGIPVTATFVACLAFAIVGTACGSPSERDEPRPSAELTSAEGHVTVPEEGPDAPRTSRGALLLAEAQRILGATKESTYTHSSTVDEGAGRFDFDCSGFVDYALERVLPDAFAQLQSATRPRPVAESFVSFFAAPRGQWSRVARAADLAPGDLVAWLKPPSVVSTNTGHVMIVAERITVGPTEVIVPIIDSTETPHGPTDARTARMATGVGAGTIVLLVDAAGAPTGYRWSNERYSAPLTTTVALGRLD
jgi:hypothetical protein